MSGSDLHLLYVPFSSFSFCCRSKYQTSGQQKRAVVKREPKPAAISKIQPKAEQKIDDVEAQNEEAEEVAEPTSEPVVVKK